MAHQQEVQRQSRISQIIAAATEGNFDEFTRLLGAKNNSLEGVPFDDLLVYTDRSNNTLLHYLLTPRKASYWSLFKDKKRSAQARILTLLLTHKDIKVLLDASNNELNTPLHLAIKYHYDAIAMDMISKGADITITTAEYDTPLMLAAKYDKTALYSKLLAKSNANALTSLSEIYSGDQIRAAYKTLKQKLLRKQFYLGMLGTLLTIACPVGAIFAFNEFPVLSVILTSLFPGLGPLSGLIGATVLGALLFWSMYSKTSKKYGACAKELLKLDSLSAQIFSYAVGLSNKAAFNSTPLLTKLQKYFRKVGPLDASRAEAEARDWATPMDQVRTYMLTFGSFLCAFSGVLGIVSGLSGFLPQTLLASAFFLGVPLIGWAALGTSLLVAGCVALWAYHAKFEPTLIDCGGTRQAVHTKQIALMNRMEMLENPEPKPPGYDYQQLIKQILKGKRMKTEEIISTPKTEPSLPVEQSLPVTRSSPELPRPEEYNSSTSFIF